MAVKDLRLITQNDIDRNPQIGVLGDIYVNPQTGDFEIVDSDEQHVQDILRADKGWWKEFPLMGAAIWKYLGSSGKEQELISVAKINLQADGYKVNSLPVVITKDNININVNDVVRL